MSHFTPVVLKKMCGRAAVKYPNDRDPRIRRYTYLTSATDPPTPFSIQRIPNNPNNHARTISAPNRERSHVDFPYIT